jgi:glycosyltransferase involved in cell wall biosynthesis
MTGEPSILQPDQTVGHGSDDLSNYDIAVIVPCYNEETAIEAVVRDFRAALPTAQIYVYDNASSDNTAQVATAAGAIVRYEARPGKGNVVRRMFADIEADIYVMVDGDDTYEAAAAPKLINKLINEQLDMVNGSRITDIKQAYRLGHRFGNALFTGIVGSVFDRQFSDILSGYRAFSHRFVKSFPALSAGFEIETELTIHALELRMPVGEIETIYNDRPEDSESKLNTIRDGFRIMMTIIRLTKAERPIGFFGGIAAALALVSLILAVPLMLTFLETGLVPRLPTAILSSAIMLLACLSLVCGLIVDSVTMSRRELRRLQYLSFARRDRSGS